MNFDLYDIFAAITIAALTIELTGVSLAWGVALGGAIVMAVDVESAKIVARDTLGWSEDLSEARVELWDSVRARLS